jgi:hypothetical protein
MGNTQNSAVAEEIEGAVKYGLAIGVNEIDTTAYIIK